MYIIPLFYSSAGSVILRLDYAGSFCCRNNENIVFHCTILTTQLHVMLLTTFPKPQSKRAILYDNILCYKKACNQMTGCVSFMLFLSHQYLWHAQRA